MYHFEKYAERALVQDLASKGWQPSKIARIFRLNKNFVYRWFHKYQYHEPIQDASRAGRPRVYTDDKERKIVKLALKHSEMSYDQLIQELQTRKGFVRLTKNLLRDIFKRHGLQRRLSPPKPHLTLSQKRDRVKWCRQRLNQDWSKVVFLDESRFQIGTTAGRDARYRTIMVGSTVSNSLTVKFGKHKNVIGFITNKRLARIISFDQNMNAEYFCAQLEAEILPSLKRKMGDDFKILMDNDPKHTSKMAKRLYARFPGNFLFLPVNSPDLNPIENVWGHMGYLIDQKNPQTKTALKEEIDIAWSEATKSEHMKNVFDSMPHRIRLVINAKGDAIDY
jgi:transposase